MKPHPDPVSSAIMSGHRITAANGDPAPLDTHQPSEEATVSNPNDTTAIIVSRDAGPPRCDHGISRSGVALVHDVDNSLADERKVSSFTKCQQTVNVFGLPLPEGPCVSGDPLRAEDYAEFHGPANPDCDEDDASRRGCDHHVPVYSDPNSRCGVAEIMEAVESLSRAAFNYGQHDGWCEAGHGRCGACERGEAAQRERKVAVLSMLQSKFGAVADVPRCVICNWPLRHNESGCTPSNCSYRPREGSQEANAVAALNTLKGLLAFIPHERRLAGMVALETLAESQRDALGATPELTYLAVPYSHPDPKIREERFIAANRVAGELMKRGELVFSPISHTHPIAETCDLPKGWDYWSAFGHAYLRASKKLVVLRAPGWEASVGVQAEIAFMAERGRPVEYVDVATGGPEPDRCPHGTPWDTLCPDWSCERPAVAHVHTPTAGGGFICPDANACPGDQSTPSPSLNDFLTTTLRPYAENAGSDSREVLIAEQVAGLVWEAARGGVDLRAVVQEIEGADLLFSGCGCGGDHCPCSRARAELSSLLSRHFSAPTQQSNPEAFGRAVLHHILNDPTFFEDERSEDWCELLQKFGYVERVIYDPDQHGEIDHVSPGDSCWIFTDRMRGDAAANRESNR